MNILENIEFRPNQAVVFDIDDTLISSKNGQPITNICNLYNYCRQKGYGMYIITARAGTPYGVKYTMRINGYPEKENIM